MALQHQHGHKVHAIAVCAFRRGAANAAGRVDAELVRLDEPHRHRLGLGDQLTNLPQQGLPQRVCADGRVDRLEPTLEAPMQGVVGDWLPVRAVRRLGQFTCGGVQREAAVAAKAIGPAIAQVGVGGQIRPAGVHGVGGGHVGMQPIQQVFRLDDGPALFAQGVGGQVRGRGNQGVHGGMLSQTQCPHRRAGLRRIKLAQG